MSWPARHDYTGFTSGRIKVLRWVRCDKNRNQFWECACSCGEVFTARMSSIIAGKSQSCGCIQREAVKKANHIHGYAKKGNKSPEYNIFQSAKSRCRNPKNPNYKYYGGRGIKFSLSSIAELVSLIGERPEPHLTLDRINNNGNYEAGNIRWATRVEQMNNTRACKKNRKA